MKKEIMIKYIGDAKEAYIELNKIVDEERKRGIKKSFNQQLLKSLKQKEELLKINPQAGVHIPHKQIPKKYFELYDVTNLWKINLTGYWRIIYTITSDQIKVTNLILDVFDHNTYNKLFSYKKK